LLSVSVAWVNAHAASGCAALTKNPRKTPPAHFQHRRILDRLVNIPDLRTMILHRLRMA
jgi:hypothetical protein